MNDLPEPPSPKEKSKLQTAGEALAKVVGAVMLLGLLGAGLLLLTCLGAATK